MKKTSLKKTALISALLLELTNTTQAATINVDGSTCTLNDAIVAANTDTASGGCSAGSGADVLELPINALIEITLTLNITSDVTLNANGSTIQPSTGNDIRVMDVSNGGDLTVNDATITTTYAGVTGGISSFGNGTRLVVNRSVVRDIPCGGITFGNGSSGEINDTLIENTGGSANNYYGAGLSVGSSNVTITNSTISNNSNANGPTAGGIWINDFYSSVSVEIINSTISGNSTPNSGGGIGHTSYNNGSSISLVNVTMVGNTATGNGGGIFNDNSDITISHSIISGNTGDTANEIFSSGGTVAVNSYNIFGQNSSPGLSGVTVGASDIVPTEPATGIFDPVLSDNGGLTPTHALVQGGPAVDVITSCLLGTDQTGKARPIDGDVDGITDCDVGAFENPNPDIIFENGFD